MHLLAEDERFSWDLYYSYDEYREFSINKKNFCYSDILPLINKLKENKLFKVEKVGSSIEDRDIFLISIGKGKTKILLWSQMHGDEPTATMALFDIFNFFSSNDGFNDFKEKLLSNVTLYFIPMLNPDGAEKFKRQNALEIDLNRDALRLQSPESSILKKVRDTIKADFGFNLHDQDTRYSVGTSFKSAAISFLAPPYNADKEINHCRQNAMKLIAYLNNILSSYIPGHIAKYSDDFEPRAFGDNIQKWGTSTILVESGGWCGDYEKQFMRKLNFIILISAFKCISSKIYKKINVSEYALIPENDKYLFDLILRNVTVKLNNRNFIIDIGINRNEEYSKDKSFFYKSTIEDIGDLSVYHGNEELNCSNMIAEPGNIYRKEFHSIKEISALNIENLLKNGFTKIILIQNEGKEQFTSLPIAIQTPGTENIVPEIAIENTPNFIIKAAGKLRYVIINGFIYDTLTGTNNIHNGLILY